MASKKRRFEEIDDKAIPSPPAKRRKIATDNNSTNQARCDSSIPPPILSDVNVVNIPCDQCSSMVRFDKYEEHMKLHETSNNSNNTNGKTLLIPCEFCSLKVSADTYHQHVSFSHTQVMSPHNYNNHNCHESKSNDEMAFWLTTPFGQQPMPYSLSLHDIIATSEHSSVIETCVIFSYMVDIPWILNTCPILMDQSKVLNIHIAHGEDINNNHCAHLRNNLFIHKVKVNMPYGTHHTKMVILTYKHEGIRVAITTANLIQPDFGLKTNAIFLQDFPLKDAAYTSDTNNDFESVLFNYCSTLRTVHNSKIIDFSFLQRYDFSSAKVALLPSVPGYHKYKYMDYYGHGRLRYLLSKYQVKAANDKLVVQVSSIGSLTQSWVANEFYKHAMLGNGDNAIKKVKLIWPTIKQVRGSIEGVMGGGSLCLSQKNCKAFMIDNGLFHKYEHKILNHSNMLNHSKMYGCVSETAKLKFFILSSANLSKAAWGALQKGASQICVRSYELGVLYLKQIYARYLEHRHRRFCLSDVRHVKRNILCGEHNDLKGNTPSLEFKILYQMNRDANANDNQQVVFPIPMNITTMQKYDAKCNDKPWMQ